MDNSVSYRSPVANRREAVLSASGDVSQISIDSNEVIETIQNRQGRRTRNFDLEVFAI